MVSMRNHLIHAYFDIDLDIVWTTVTPISPRSYLLWTQRWPRSMSDCAIKEHAAQPRPVTSHHRRYRYRTACCVVPRETYTVFKVSISATILARIGGNPIVRTSQNRSPLRPALHAAFAEDLPHRMGRDDSRLSRDHHHARAAQRRSDRRNAEEAERGHR